MMSSGNMEFYESKNFEKLRSQYLTARTQYGALTMLAFAKETETNEINKFEAINWLKKSLEKYDALFMDGKLYKLKIESDYLILHLHYNYTKRSYETKIKMSIKAWGIKFWFLLHIHNWLISVAKNTWTFASSDEYIFGDDAIGIISE